MALVLAKFDGGTTPASLASILGTGVKKHFRQFVIWADPDNSGSVYLGGSDVTSAPTNEHLKLKADKSLNLGPSDAQRPFVVDTEHWYVVGSAASQVLWVIVNTDDSTN